MSKKGSGLGKFALGAGLGAGLALLFAPKKGTDLRRDIKKKFDAFMDDVDDLTIAEIKEEFTNKVEEIKEGIEDLEMGRTTDEDFMGSSHITFPIIKDATELYLMPRS